MGLRRERCRPEGVSARRISVGRWDPAGRVSTGVCRLGFNRWGFRLGRWAEEAIEREEGVISMGSSTRRGVGPRQEFGFGSEGYLGGYKKIAVEEGCFVSPKSVLRFQVERGEFPRYLSAYRNYVVPPAAFAIWADDILGNADFMELL
ncbi:hypothetical protein RHMOL_Rhmol11G0038200 [Rhododendron molle]|uniref:Uncharacterized protein n=1 Tax=Rhododendron molle TaxID=49168 RepID=A0ACC0LPL9_RHOML|nr:hypothetical protein RHMOL_Rhmol11G0038200 [Rhododendron molle]